LKLKIVLVLMLLAASAFSATVDEIVKEALLKSPRVEIAKGRLNISDYQFREAIGKFLPSIGFSYSKVSMSDVPAFEFGIPPAPPSRFRMLNRNYYRMGINLNQKLFTGGYLTFNALEKRAERSAAYYSFLETVNEVVNTVKKDYFTLCEAKSSVEIAESFLKSSRSHYSDVKAFFDEGIVPERDVLEAKVNVRRAEEQLERAENFYRIALERLKRDVGDENLSVRVDKLGYRKVAITENEAVDRALRSRPLLLSLKEREKSGRYGVKLSYSQFLPEVVLSLSYSRTDQYPMNGNFRSRSASITLNVPIFQGSQRFWRVREAKERLRIAELSLKDAKNLVRLQVTSAYSSLRSAEARIRTAEAMVKRARELLRDSRERYREHVGTSTEVTDAISYLAEAMGMLNSALADYNRALSDLEYAVGGNLK